MKTLINRFGPRVVAPNLSWSRSADDDACPVTTGCREWTIASWEPSEECQELPARLQELTHVWWYYERLSEGLW